MTDNELEQHLKNSVTSGVFSPCSLISHRGNRGIAYLIGENWSRAWQSGDVAVLWWNGDLTILPDEFEVLKLDHWS